MVYVTDADGYEGPRITAQSRAEAAAEAERLGVTLLGALVAEVDASDVDVERLREMPCVA